MKYKVIGPRSVVGVPTGGTVDIDDDSPVDVAGLIAAGHVEPVRVERRPRVERDRAPEEAGD